MTLHLPATEPRPQAPAVRGRARRMLPPVVVGGTLAAAVLALHLRDPHQQGSWGLCPSAAMGFSCPGCGGLRAVNDLTHLQFVDAASSNLLFFVALPFLAYAFARWTHGRWTGRRWQMSDRAQGVTAVLVLVGLVGFTVLRNLPAGAWLAP